MSKKYWKTHSQCVKVLGESRILIKMHILWMVAITLEKRCNNVVDIFHVLYFLLMESKIKVQERKILSWFSLFILKQDLSNNYKWTGNLKTYAEY